MSYSIKQKWKNNNKLIPAIITISFLVTLFCVFCLDLDNPVYLCGMPRESQFDFFCFRIVGWKKVVLVLCACLCAGPFLIEYRDDKTVDRFRKWKELGFALGLLCFYLALVSLSSFRANMEMPTEILNADPEDVPALFQQAVWDSQNPLDEARQYRLLLSSEQMFFGLVCFLLFAHMERERKRGLGGAAILAIIVLVCLISFLNPEKFYVFSDNLMLGILSLFGIASIMIASWAATVMHKAEESELVPPRSCETDFPLSCSLFLLLFYLSGLLICVFPQIRTFLGYENFDSIFGGELWIGLVLLTVLRYFGWKRNRYIGGLQLVPLFFLVWAGYWFRELFWINVFASDICENMVDYNRTFLSISDHVLSAGFLTSVPCAFYTLYLLSNWKLRKKDVWRVLVSIVAAVIIYVLLIEKGKYMAFNLALGMLSPLLILVRAVAERSKKRGTED